MTSRWWRIRSEKLWGSLGAACILLGCSAIDEMPPGTESTAESTEGVAAAPAPVEIPREGDGGPSSGALLINAAQAAPPPVGVIVRFKEQATLERHARERGRGRNAARAALAQRVLLRTEHTRLIDGLRRKLGGLAQRSGKGRVVGKSYDDFTDVLNGLALYGVDEAAAKTLFANEPQLLSIEPIRQVEATLLQSVPMIDADDVWALPDSNGVGMDGTGLRIGIIDTGVDYTHPDLGGCFGPGCKVAGGYDFVNHDADPMDDFGHGTHVAATAAGNGTYAASGGPAPLRGVAPGAEIYAYKVLGSNGIGYTPDIIAAIERCADPNDDGDPADHLDVCNLSLGGSGTPDDAQSIAVDNATANGVVFSISAGNSGPGASTIGSPGTSRRAITVAAACKSSAIGVDSRCLQPIASFSSRGPVIWNGPGGAQSLAKPDVAAPGVNICAAELGTTNSGSRCLDTRHVQLSGTSMAAPHIAGVAALLRQAHPEWTPDQVKSFIVTSAHDLGLDSATQGSGLVDVLDAVTLGGLPSHIARVGGTPLHDLDVPTTRYGAFTSDITVTNTTTGSLTFDSSFSGDAGLTVTLVPTSLTLAAGATGTMTVTRNVDHDVVPSGVTARGTITLSSSGGNVALGVSVGVRDRLTATPSTVDLGVDLASQASFSQTVSVQLANVRTDAPQTYTASVSCCATTSQDWSSVISATVDQSSISVGPGGTVSLGVTVSSPNTIPNGRFNGSLTLTSSLGTVTVPLTFFKGYGVRVDTTSLPQTLAISSAQSGSTTQTVLTNSTTFYSTTPGPFFVEAVWPYLNTKRHVLAVANTDVPLAVVSLNPTQASSSMTLRPRTSTGAVPSFITGTYRFTHSASGGGVINGINASITDGFPIYVSAVPDGVSFTASVVSTSPEWIGLLYEAAGPFSGSRTFNNAPSDLLTKEIRAFRPATGQNPIYFQPEACLTLFPWAPTTAGGAIPDARMSCYLTSGVLLPSGVGQMRFYNSANRDLLAAPYPDAPFVSYQLLDGSASGSILYRGPLLYPSKTHPLTWNMITPWYGTTRANEAYARFKCDEPPGNVLPVGQGPLLDQWGWWNLRTAFSGQRALKGQFENPFIWGGCLQDQDTSTFPVSYRLLKNGALVQAGTLTIQSPVYPTLSDGQYRFEMTRSAAVSGQTVNVETVSTFTAASLSSIDENPPALESLHLVGRGLWQDVLDPAVVNQLRFRVNPMPGYVDYGAQPPLFTTLSDDVASLKVEQGPDGQSWSEVSASAVGNGEYLTDPLAVDTATTLAWFRISVTDLAGNTLRYTFQIPRGTSYAAQGADVTPPSTAITSPSAGAVLTGTTTVTATATDAVGVTRVDLLVDHVKVSSSLSAPYTFRLNAAALTLGSHELQTRAEDAGGNVGFSAPITVTTQNGDTSPPSVAFTAPASGALLRQSVLVTATASDDNAVQRVDFYDGSTLIGTATSAPYTVSWNTVGAASGSHTLKATAFDPAENSATATLGVTVDNNAPTVALTSPVNGSAVHDTVTVAATATDDVAVASVTFFADGAPLGTLSAAPFSVAWNTTSLTPGSHTLNARALDTAGNSSVSPAITVTVAAETTPPTVSILSPTDGAVITTSMTVSIDAHDDSGIDWVDLYEGSSLIFITNGLPYGFTWDMAGVADGPHTYVAHATDKRGNVATSTPVHITLDKTAPVVSITAPVDAARVSGSVPFQATASDTVALDTVSLLIDGVPLWTGSAPPFATTWNTTQVTDGAHTLGVRARDKAGNESVTSVNVVVDNAKPTVSIAAPANGAVITGVVPWTAVAADNVGVARVELRDGSTVVATLTTSPYTFNWNTASVSTGVHTLTARAFDGAGNQATSANVSVTIDRSAPTVSLTAPAAGATLSGTVTVSANASDNVGLARVEFYRDNTVLLGTDTTSPYSISWNTSTTPAGSHTLKAVAYDRAGNATTSSTRTVTVKDVTAPTVSITSPANGGTVSQNTTVTIAANASDETGVNRVQFLVANVVTCTDVTAPYTCAWRVPAGVGRSYALVAKAFDAAGNSKSSTTVNVTAR